MLKLTDLKGWDWPKYWDQLRSALLNPKVDDEVLEQLLREARNKIPVPVLWLIGKTQAGKTSIISALTGSEAAEIGNGFQPCTRHSSFYHFPEDAPIVTFLDTRGLGEVAYDPAEDIHYCESKAHLMIAVMKVADINQDVVFDVLHAARQRHPEWPILIVQTGLHELYPHGFEHIEPWPFAHDQLPESVPVALKNALITQRNGMPKLPGSAPINWVAIDFTLPEDGFKPEKYGLEALWQAIESVTSFGLQSLLSGDQSVHDLFAQAAHQQTMSYSYTAAGLGALPVVDWVAVSAIQAKLLHSLSVLYGQRWDKRTITEFLSLVGAGMATGYLARMIGRAVAKVIPVWGQTVGAVWGASSSGATTYALGKAAIYFFTQRKDGLVVDQKTLQKIYAEAFENGAQILRKSFSEQSL